MAKICAISGSPRKNGNTEKMIKYIANNNEYELVDEKGQNKKIIIEGMTSHDNENLHTWITEGYTIESYLMDEFINLNFDVESNNRIKLKSGKNKVQIAKDYIEKGNFESKYDLFQQIEKVYNTLTRWNS